MSQLKTIASIFANSERSTEIAVISEEKVPDEIVFAVTVALFQQFSNTTE